MKETNKNYICFIFVNFVNFLIESRVVCTHFDENNDNFIQIGGNWQDYGNQSCYLQDEQNSNTIDKGKLYVSTAFYNVKYYIKKFVKEFQYRRSVSRELAFLFVFYLEDNKSTIVCFHY